MFHPWTSLAYYELNKELKTRSPTYGYNKSNPNNSQAEFKSSESWSTEIFKTI